MPRLTPLAVTALALLALLGLGAHNAASSTSPYTAYLPAINCADCAGRTTTPTPGPGAYASRMINLVNQQRAVVGCRAVTPNDALMRGAQAWSEKMTREGFVAHTPSDYYRNIGYTGGMMVENIGPGETPEYAFEGWMESPAHKRNMEWCYPINDPSYDPARIYDVGVGYAWPGYWTLVISNHLP